VDYRNYDIQDFLEDDNFINWVLGAAPEDDEFWKNFESENPGKTESINKSKIILKSLLSMETSLPSGDIDKLWERIHNSTISRRKNQRKIGYWIVAASTLVAVVGSLFFVYLKQGNQKEINYDAIKSVASASNEIKLVLSDSSEMKIAQSDAELKYDSNGNLLFNSKKIEEGITNETSGKPAFNQLIVPRGKRSSILFSDGTKLWINSGSRAIYPVVFDHKKREIFIEGEAFLEVSHDPARPFIVKTEAMDIKVLGTSFNINAYPEDETASIVLVKGSVEAAVYKQKKVLLTPNQMISYSKETNKVSLQKVDVFEHISWKEGWMLINSENLESIIEKLSRYYDRDIKFLDEKAKTFQISGKLDLKDSIDQVLRIISSTAPVKAEIKENLIVISIK
jgi:hypothetical protein